MMWTRIHCWNTKKCFQFWIINLDSLFISIYKEALMKLILNRESLHDQFFTTYNYFQLYKRDSRNVQRRSRSWKYKLMNWIHSLIEEFNMSDQHIYELTEALTNQVLKPCSDFPSPANKQVVSSTTEWTADVKVECRDLSYSLTWTKMNSFTMTYLNVCASFSTKTSKWILIIRQGNFKYI